MSDEILQFRFQNLHEFVKVARQNLDRNNWDYLIGGSESETTLARNRLALDAIGFRPRVLRDVSKVDCSRTLFGRNLRIPVLCAPVGSLQHFEPGGGGTGPAAAAHVRRTIDKGYAAFALTVDTDSYSRRERDIAKRHQRRRVRVDDARIYQAQFNWRDIERIKKNFDIPLIIKGIATAEDARIAVEHGVDCVYVSNHGGRQLDQGVGSIEVLPEVVEAVGGRARVMVDGSITRGTAVVKAITLGAAVVVVGRLYVYGLAGAGGPGILRLFEILEDEIRLCLTLLGVTGYRELDSSYIRAARPVVPAHVHSPFPHLDLPKETY